MPLVAGTAVRDISPSEPVFLVGYPHVRRISTGIHDPLLASALYLQNQTTGLLTVALDLLFISALTARELRAIVSARIGIPPENVFISCTHTHSGPVTNEMIAWREDPVVPAPDEGYMRRLKNNVVQAAEEAVRRSRPAEIACTFAIAEGVGGNRLSAEGTSDPEVGILVARERGTDKLLAISLTYSMHPTVLHEDSTLVSADFPGFTRQFLIGQLGQQLTVLYHTGPSGNQSPRYSVRSQSFEEARRLGESLGESVLKAMRSLTDTDFSDDPPLGARTTAVDLPRRRMPSVAEAEQKLEECVASYERLKKEKAAHGTLRTAECAVFGAEETVFLARCEENGALDTWLQDYLPAEVQVLRIGNVFLAGLPGEPFVEYGLELKRKSPSKVVVVSLVNGDLQGYIVTPEAAEAGGYEAANSVFSPQAGSLLVDAALRLISEG